MVGEVITSTAYVELFIRKVTEPELIRAFLAFIFTSADSDSVEPPIITTLISRLHSPNSVSDVDWSNLTCLLKLYLLGFLS